MTTPRKDIPERLFRPAPLTIRTVRKDLTLHYGNCTFSVAGTGLGPGDEVQIEDMPPGMFPEAVFLCHPASGPKHGEPIGVFEPVPNAAAVPQSETSDNAQKADIGLKPQIDGASAIDNWRNAGGFKLFVPARTTADLAVPPRIGCVRTRQRHDVDAAGFIREVIADMVRAGHNGTHTQPMQLTSAAAAWCELASAIDPEAGIWARALCFPDEVDLKALQAAEPFGLTDDSQRFPDPDWTSVEVSISGCFDYAGRTYGCMHAAGKAVYIEPIALGSTSGVHVWAGEPHPETGEAHYITCAWPLPPQGALA